MSINLKNYLLSNQDEVNKKENVQRVMDYNTNEYE